MIVARILALIALIGVVAIDATPARALPFWVIVSIAGFAGGIIALWIQAEWRNIHEDDNNES
jgi:hypothetical protein